MRTISLLATAAVAATVLTTVTADAGIVIGAGVQRFSSQTKLTEVATGVSFKKNGANFGGDLMVGYTFSVAPSVTVTPLVEIQTKGKELLVIDNNVAGADVTANAQRQMAYGAKVRVGYNVSPKVTLFADAGMRFSKIKISGTVDGNAGSDNTSISGLVVGAGVAYKVTNDVSVLASYDRVMYGKKKYSAGVASVKVTENNFRLGVAYEFAI